MKIRSGNLARSMPRRRPRHVRRVQPRFVWSVAPNRGIVPDILL